jgi:hypothetical protein
MFVPCIAGLCIKTNTVHWVTSIYVYWYAAPTCFGTYVPSSGSVFVLVSYVKTETAVLPSTAYNSTTNRHTDHTSSR